MTYTNAATTNGDTTTNCGIDLIGNDNTACNAAIHIQALSGATNTFSKISVNGSAQTGINGFSVRNLTLDTVEVQNVGDATNEHGVVLKNLLGTSNAIANSDFHNNRSRQLYVINVVDDNPNPTPVLNITASKFRSSTDAQGALFDSYNSGNIVVNFGNDTVGGANTVSNNFSNGLQQSVGLGGDMTITIKRNGFTNNNSAIVLQAAGVGATSTLTYTIWNNTTLTGANSGSSAIVVGGTQQHQINGDIRGNTIGDATVGSGAKC